MPTELFMTWADCLEQAKKLAKRIRIKFAMLPRSIYIYGVPRGGIHVAQLIRSERIELVHDPNEAHVIVDDIIDSGRTKRFYENKYSRVPFLALIPKKQKGTWYSFPWERMQNELPAEDAIIRILQVIGEDPLREGLRETPARVARSWTELYSGYGADPMAVIKSFEDGSCSEMVVLKDIEFYSSCEHHMLP